LLSIRVPTFVLIQK